MKELYIEDLANHNDPESCVCYRKVADEALTGAHIGRVLSREIRCNQGADDVVLCGRQYGRVRYGKCMPDPARSKAPSMCGNSMCEIREIPYPPCADINRDVLERPEAVTQ